MAAKTTSNKRKAATSDTTTAKKPRTASTTKASTTKKSQPKAAPAAEAEELPFEASDSDSAPEDDQTAALLKGFESSSESEAEEDVEDDGPNPLKALDITTLPDPSQSAKAKAITSSSVTTPANAQDPTVVYISRIPHGFYEHQMREYFSQFGTIARLRLSRNRRTGAPKHYAFVEFESPHTARIVAQTMDNYLMFKHILKCKLVPKEQVHEDLWKGAGKRFRNVPWNRIERARVASSDRAGWEKRVKLEEKRRAEKKEKLAALGYEFEAPRLREVEDVPVRVVEGQAETKAIEDVAAAVKQITEKPDKVIAGSAALSQEKPKKDKKAKKQAKENTAVKADVVMDEAEGASTGTIKKTKQDGTEVPMTKKKARKV